MQIKSLLYISTFLLFVGGFISCDTSPTRVVEKEENCLLQNGLQDKISFGALEEKNVQFELDLTGNVSYNKDELYTFQSLVTGIVENTHFKLGDYVQKGQLLLEIRSTSLGEFRRSLNMAEADIEIAERNLASLENMHESGLSSDRELLIATKELEEARLKLRHVEETILIHGGQLERGLLTIRAPQSGYIVQKNITKGSTIAEGNEDIFAISNLKKVWVEVNVYPAQINLLKEGDAVEISTTAYQEERFQGKISRISNVFDPEEKVMKAIIEMENPGLKLKPDMMVNVHLMQQTEQQAFAIPIDVVLFDNDQYHFIWAKNDCDAAVITFEPLGKDKTYYFFQTTHEGIEVGSRFVNQNNILIYNELKNR